MLGVQLSKYPKLRNVLAVICAITGALYIEAFCFIRWWHPSCNAHDDGASYYAIGIPFPFAEPTPFTSTYRFVPIIFLANIVLLTVLVFPLFRGFSCSLSGRNRKLNYVVAALSGVLFLLEIARWWLSAGFMFYMAGSLPIPHRDSYLSYRPEIIALHEGNSACDTWWTEHTIFPPMWWW